MNRVELKLWSKSKLKNNLWNLWKGILFVSLINFGYSYLELLARNEIVLSLLQNIISIILYPLSVGLCAFFVYFVKDGNLNYNCIFDYFGQFWKLFKIYILISIIEALGLVCFIIPGIYLMFSYVLVPYLLVLRPELTISETLTLSRNMMKGHKLDLFVLGLSFLGWGVLSFLTFGILIIWVYPYIEISVTKFCLNIIDNYKN